MYKKGMADVVSNSLVVLMVIIGVVVIGAFVINVTDSSETTLKLKECELSNIDNNLGYQNCVIKAFGEREGRLMLGLDEELSSYLDPAVVYNSINGADIDENYCFLELKLNETIGPLGDIFMTEYSTESTSSSCSEFSYTNASACVSHGCSYATNATFCQNGKRSVTCNELGIRSADKSKFYYDDDVCAKLGCGWDGMPDRTCKGGQNIDVGSFLANSAVCSDIEDLFSGATISRSEGECYLLNPSLDLIIDDVERNGGVVSYAPVKESCYWPSKRAAKECLETFNVNDLVILNVSYSCNSPGMHEVFNWSGCAPSTQGNRCRVLMNSNKVVTLNITCTSSPIVDITGPSILNLMEIKDLYDDYSYYLKPASYYPHYPYTVKTYDLQDEHVNSYSFVTNLGLGVLYVDNFIGLRNIKIFRGDSDEMVFNYTLSASSKCTRKCAMKNEIIDLLLDQTCCGDLVPQLIENGNTAVCGSCGNRICEEGEKYSCAIDCKKSDRYYLSIYDDVLLSDKAPGDCNVYKYPSILSSELISVGEDFTAQIIDQSIFNQNKWWWQIEAKGANAGITGWAMDDCLMKA